MNIEFIFKSSFGENLSPRATNDRQSRYHHFKTTELMDLIEKLSIEHELSPQRKNGSSVMHSEQGGIQLPYCNTLGHSIYYRNINCRYDCLIEGNYSNSYTIYERKIFWKNNYKKR